MKSKLNELKIRTWLSYFKLKAMFKLPTIKAYAKYAQRLKVVGNINLFKTMSKITKKAIKGLMAFGLAFVMVLPFMVGWFLYSRNRKQDKKVKQ